MRRIIILTVLLGIIATILVVACGSPSPKAPPHNVPAPVSGHPCTTQNFYMQCVPQSSLVAPHKVTATPSTQFGVDFAWGGPSVSVARADGIRFGASYLSFSSKDWSSALAHAYANAGLGVVFVWETSASRPTDGGSFNANFNDGYNDASNGFSEARDLGFSKNVHIDFAADYDTSGFSSEVVPYYEGARAYAKHLGNGASVGAYGGLATIEAVCRAGIEDNWQTLAWSSGVVIGGNCAPLYQRGINNRIGGFSSLVDDDLAFKPYYGQSNYTPPIPSTPVPPKAQVCTYMGIGSWTVRGLPAGPHHYVKFNKHGGPVKFEAQVYTGYGRWRISGLKGNAKASKAHVVTAHQTRSPSGRACSTVTFNNGSWTIRGGAGGKIHWGKPGLWFSLFGTFNTKTGPWHGTPEPANTRPLGG